MGKKPVICITLIYTPFWGTEEFMRSCERVDMPVYNAFDGSQFRGHGDSLRMLYAAMEKLKDEYEYVIYSDGADTVFMKYFVPPAAEMIYSAEKACYPLENEAPLYPPCDTPWKYLNAGNWCGPIDLCMEFFERYGLCKYQGEINGQLEVQHAFLAGVRDGFKVRLDYTGEYFQTIAFNDHKADGTVAFGKGDDFRVITPIAAYTDYTDNSRAKVMNRITGAEPCVLHGNGRTDMKWIYDLFKAPITPIAAYTDYTDNSHGNMADAVGPVG